MNRTQQMIYRYLEKARADCNDLDAGAFQTHIRILADLAVDFAAEQNGTELSAEPVKE